MAGKLALTGAGNSGAAGASAYAFIGQVVTAGNNGTVTSGALNTTGATFLSVIVVHYGGTPGALTDSLSNAWNARTTYGSGNYFVTQYWSRPTSVGVGHTFSVASVVDTYPCIAVMAFSGGSALPYDTENGVANASYTTIQSGSITPSQNNCLVIAGQCWSSSTTCAINGGFSSPQFVKNAVGNIYVGQSYLIQTTAAAANPTWTVNQAVNSGAANIASFK